MVQGCQSSFDPALSEALSGRATPGSFMSFLRLLHEAIPPVATFVGITAVHEVKPTPSGQRGGQKRLPAGASEPLRQQGEIVRLDV